MVDKIVSQAFCCGTCAGDVVLELSQGGELYYICQNSKCQRAVSVDCPEALALKEQPEPVQAAPATASERKAIYHLSQGVKLVAHAGGYLVPSGTRSGVVHFVSADGACSCEAGQKGRGCWHVAAVAQQQVGRAA